MIDLFLGLGLTGVLAAVAFVIFGIRRGPPPPRPPPPAPRMPDYERRKAQIVAEEEANVLGRLHRRPRPRDIIERTRRRHSG